MKKIISIISMAVALLMLLPLFCFNVSAVESALPEKPDTVELVRDNCYFREDKFMIPFRAFWETFGAAVDWDDKQETATAHYKSETCEFEINVFMVEKPQIKNIWSNNKADMTVVVNGVTYPVFFDIPAEMVADRIYIPADILTDMFGADLIYEWHKVTVKIKEENILEMTHRETEKAEMIDFINKARVENGLNPLKKVVSLDKISYIKVKDKAKYKYSGHISPILGFPADMMTKFTTEYIFTGECLYYCSIKVTPEQAFEAWMASLGHKAAILYEQAQYIGVNVTMDENGGIYWILTTAR